MNEIKRLQNLQAYFDTIPESKGQVYNLSLKEFVKAIDTINSYPSIGEKLDYYYKITGDYFRDTIKLYKIKDEVYEWTVEITNSYERIARGKWLEKNMLPKLYESALKNYQSRLTKCKTLQEKKDLSIAILKNSKQQRRKVPLFKTGYEWRKLKDPDTIYSNYSKHVEFSVFFAGCVDYILRVYIKEEIQNNFGLELKKGIKKISLFPDDKPENKDILISTLQHFNIIDKKDKAIPAPLGKAQFINGIIDALKQKNILTQHPHTTLHKLLCKELNITYKRVSLRKNKTDGAYTRGLEETLSYLAK